MLKDYRRLLAFLGPYRTQAAGAMGAMVLYGSLNAAPIPLVKRLLDDAFLAQDFALLQKIAALLVLAFTLKGAVFYLQHYHSTDIGQKVVRDLRDRLYAKYVRLPVAFFTGTHTGDLSSRVLNDIQQVRGALADGFLRNFRDLIAVGIMIGAVIYLNPRFAALALLILPLSGGLIVWFSRKLRKYSRQSQVRTASLSTILIETVGGIRIVKAFGMEAQEIERFRETNHRLYRTWMKTTRVTGVSPPLMEWLGAVGTALLIVAVGHLVVRGSMTPGDFFAFLAAVGMLYQPVRNIGRSNESIQAGLAAAERIFEILDMEDPMVDPSQPAAFPCPIRRGIVFRNVSFAYAPGMPVLEGIDLEVPPGRTFALVGASGSGKTSLVNLIPRFHDVTEGAIEIDGVDLRRMRLSDLRSHMALVTQETVLFQDTVRNNIAYGSGDRSLEEIRDAARAANALEFIEAMPEGFDTRIGERGMTLSGGQRQRIAIARAILRNAPILILDEATSSLDSESEREVQQAVDRLVGGRTAFVIAHRLSTVRNADGIVVLGRGRIVERGTHAELMALRGEYHRLWTIAGTQPEENRP